MAPPTFSVPIQNGEQKLAELILYIADKAPKFGATKLNKTLVFSDFIAYFRLGTPITGVEYMRLPQGPVPRRLLPIVNGMREAGELVTREVTEGKYTTRLVIPLRPAKLDLFLAAEIAIVDEVIRAFKPQTATAVSNFSHGIAWKAAKDDQVLIPYESVFLSDKPLTAYDIARSQELAQELSWPRE